MQPPFPEAAFFVPFKTIIPPTGEFPKIFRYKRKKTSNAIIEQNPVQARLCAKASDWQWSSANCYLNWNSDGIVDPNRHPLLPFWPDNPDERHQVYINYLDNMPEDDLQVFDSDATSIGDDKFKNKLTSISGRKQIRRGRPTKSQ